MIPLEIDSEDVINIVKSSKEVSKPLEVEYE